MSATFSLFERWKANKGFTSDAQAASALGVTRGAVHLWRGGRNGSAAVIERMANDLGEDAIPVILQAFAEAARDAEDRRALTRMAKKLAASSMALLLAVMPYFAPTNASAEGLREGRRLDHLYIMRNCAMRKILAALAAALAFIRVRPPRLQPHDKEPVTWTPHLPASCPSNP